LLDQYHQTKDMLISGRILIITATGLTAIAALFCIIGLSTKGWLTGVYGLFCDQLGCSRSASALSIISFLLLIATIITLVLHMFDILRGVLRYIPFILLLISSIFLLGTFVAYVKPGVGYSFDLMVAAHFFSYAALAIAAYWYGQLDATSGSTG